MNRHGPSAKTSQTGIVTVDLDDAMKGRKMVRSFTPEPIEQATLTRILDLARRAPSAGNTQAVEFLVLHGQEAVSSYWETTMSEEAQRRFRWQSLLCAPAIVLVLTDPDSYLRRYSEPDKQQADRGQSTERWPVPYWWFDAGAVVQNVLLQATSNGLGACFFGPFDHEDALKNTFGVPKSHRIVASIAVGHPAPDELGRSASRKRRPLSETAHWGRWGATK